MDFGWQESAGVNLAMDEARRILSADEDARIEFFVHGKDIKMFSQGKTYTRPALIRNADDLGQDERIKFNVCAHALLYKNLSIDDFSPYFNVVDYVPDSIQSLRDQGYRPLNFAGKKRQASDP